MERVGEHPIPAGPLAVRWLGVSLPRLRAGMEGQGRVLLENAGSAPWRARGAEAVLLSSHWLDALGNPVFWDGPRIELPHDVAPGASVELPLRTWPQRPPGPYRLALDLLVEFRFWFGEVGSHVLELPVRLEPRIEHRRLAVVVHGGDDARTAAALAAQEEAVVETEPEATAHLVAGAEPALDWARRLLDAHAEGWAVVGPGLDLDGRGDRRRLAPWTAPGRNPRFGEPLLLPSLLAGHEPSEHESLPAWNGAGGLYDGRIRVRLRPPRGRRRS